MSSSSVQRARLVDHIALAQLAAVVVFDAAGEHHDRVDDGPDDGTEQDRKAEKAANRLKTNPKRPKHNWAIAIWVESI